MFRYRDDPTLGGLGGTVKAMLKADPNFGKCTHAKAFLVPLHSFCEICAWISNHVYIFMP